MGALADLLTSHAVLSHPLKAEKIATVADAAASGMHTMHTRAGTAAQAERGGFTSPRKETRFEPCRVWLASCRSAAKREDTKLHASVGWSSGAGTSSDGRKSSRRCSVVNVCSAYVCIHSNIFSLRALGSTCAPNLALDDEHHGSTEACADM